MERVFSADQQNNVDTTNNNASTRSLTQINLDDVDPRHSTANSAAATGLRNSPVYRTISMVGSALKTEVQKAWNQDYSPREASLLRRKEKKRPVISVDQFVPETTGPITVRRYVDYRPREDTDATYFTQIHGTPSGLAVVIPFFNETSYELQQTLNSLSAAFQVLQRESATWREKNMHVCLIQDGWHKADESMKTYLKRLFPVRVNGMSWHKLPEFQPGFRDETNNAVYVFESRHYEPIEINIQSGLPSCFMTLTLLVKINNRRKHNSHEWFIGKNGFAEATNAEYLFLTDAFTLYSEYCIYYLVKHLDQTPNISSVTGRQRLMTREQQGCTNESVFSLGYLFRMVQLADFELANCVYNGAFHLGGMLPVIPGPCGMYRAEVLTSDAVREAYFGVVNLDPDATGLIVGNLKTAEDRVLSYESVVKMDHRYMAFNNLAVFYFEAETDPEKFLLQRRRWINGSVAGYIYLLFNNFGAFLRWRTSLIRKIYIWILLMCQLFTYLMVGISPGITLKILYYGIEYFANYYDWDIDLILTGIFTLIWALYIGHVVIHNRVKFDYTIFYALLTLSFVTSIVTVASIFHYAFISTQPDDSEFVLIFQIVLLMGLFVMGAPFLLALFLSGRGHSTMFMIKSFVPYLLFLPMLIAWFGSYSYSRTWDLSWGNRPASELSNVVVAKRELIVKKYKNQSVLILLFLLVCNMVVFFLPLIAQVILVGSFFAVVIYQMFFSFVYSLIRFYFKVRVMVHRCFSKFKRRRERRRSRRAASVASVVVDHSDHIVHQAAQYP